MRDRLIRPATGDDLEAIVAIYNEVIRTSFTVWRENPTSVTEREEWLAQASVTGSPILVATDDSGVLGFIAAERFRPWAGYAATWEHSIHVRYDARSEGIGRSLYGAMEEVLRHRAAHILVAGIDSANTGSVRFHERLGFVQTGYMPEVGRMRGTWRDLLLLQKTLAD